MNNLQNTKMNNKPTKSGHATSKIPTSGRDSGTHSRSSSVSNLTTASDIHSAGRTGSRLRVGERITVSSLNGVKSGTLKFIGETLFAKGQWAGIELDEPTGKNDGSVGGKRYFICHTKHGLFARLDKVHRPGGPRFSVLSSDPVLVEMELDRLDTAEEDALLLEQELHEAEFAEITRPFGKFEITAPPQLEKRAKITESDIKDLEADLEPSFVQRELMDMQLELEEERISRSEFGMQLQQRKVTELELNLKQLSEEKEEISKHLNAVIQEKDDMINTLKNEVKSYIEKVTQLIEDNRNLSYQISLKEEQAKGKADDVTKELGE